MKTLEKYYNVNTIIPDLRWEKLNDNGIEQYCKYILNIRNIKNIEKSTGQGFFEPLCYDYVFDKDDINFFEPYNVVDYLHTHYKQINILEAKEGNIITYHDQNEEITHYAKIYETNNTIEGTIIRSKWGRFGVFETDLYAVPKMYGNCIRIWKKR